MEWMADDGCMQHSSQQEARSKQLGALQQAVEGRQPAWTLPPYHTYFRWACAQKPLSSGRRMHCDPETVRRQSTSAANAMQGDTCVPLTAWRGNRSRRAGMSDDDAAETVLLPISRPFLVHSLTRICWKECRMP